MPNEIDRKLLPGFLQASLNVWLGVTYKSFEMMKSPQESVGKVMSEMKGLFSVPSDAGDGLQKKLEAVASEWMRKGATLMEDCKAAGKKFTGDE